MSTELENLAETSLSVLAGLECGFDGGPIGPNGHCSEEWHAHCPFCGENWDCAHEVARWDDSWGYRGPEFPSPPESDDAICAQPAERLHEAFGDLAPVWGVYLQHRDESAESAGTDLLEALIEILDLKVVAVEWEQNDSPCSGCGKSFFASNGSGVRAVLEVAAARVQELFDRFEEAAKISEQHAERALAVMAQQMCEDSGSPIDRAVGYCGLPGGYDRTHTHCPFCESGDVCPHILGQCCDDVGYSGPEMPAAPEEWDIPADWTDSTLREVLGDLRPAFLAYPEHGNEFGVFAELAELVDSAVHPVSWCGNGRGAGIGVNYFAADVRGATTQLRVLAGRLEAAISQLAALREPRAVGSDEVER